MSDPDLAIIGILDWAQRWVDDEIEDRLYAAVCMSELIAHVLGEVHREALQSVKRGE